MRPLYQRYHEVRGELDALQGSIEKKYGLIPLFSEDGGDLDKIIANAASGSSGGAGPGSASGNTQQSTRRLEAGPGTVKILPISMASTSEQIPQVSGGLGSGGSLPLADPFSSFLLKSPSSAIATPTER